MNKRIDFLSIPIDALTMEETLSAIDSVIQSKSQMHHTVVNAGKIVLMSKDPQLFKSVTEADLINADGQAVVWAARLMGKKLPERVAGIDLMNRLIERAHQNGYKAFFFGAKEEIVKKVVQVVSEKYSPAVVAGYRNGYFKPEDAPRIAEQISKSGAQLLFVAISSPTKENFLHQYKDFLQNVNFIMGVGGSFDVLAGLVQRAPVWMQKMGLEWLYRFLQEPVRMCRRYTIGNLEFMALVMKGWIKGGKS
jgi:N-acetylglucosaminyldiphosphoundecaprenol N-acetyl-beta-D-mannosaminyltransferase